MNLFDLTSFSIKVVLNPLNYASALKYFLTSDFYRNGSTTANSVKLGELGTKNHKAKAGPIVLFFEVNGLM